MTPHSSLATTISDTNSEEAQNWYDIDLPPVYRPLSTPIKNQVVHRFRGDANDRGTIIFIPEHPIERSEQTKMEVPGIHNTSVYKKRTLWTKTKDRLMGNRRQIQIQNYLEKHKSEEMNPDVKVDIETERPGTTRLCKGFLESAL